MPQMDVEDMEFLLSKNTKEQLSWSGNNQKRVHIKQGKLNPLFDNSVSNFACTSFRTSRL